MLSNYLSSPAVVQSGLYKYTSINSINDEAADGEFFDFYLKSVQENFVYKGPCFESKIKNKIELDSEHLFQLATLGIR